MHVIGTAGHVDHGKSTLVERLTGIDPDRFAEEKRRGLTIDLGFAWLELPSGNEIGIIDVPGHERFIRNMLAGAGGTTICLFVVAANEGWKPQSAEHLAILDVLGSTHGVVALTKIDLVEESQRDEVAADISSRLSGSSLAGAPVVGCSALTGAGMDDLISALDEVVAATPLASDLGRPRLWVDRVFTIAGAGTVVTGTLAGGSLAVGEDVLIEPVGRPARIRSMQSHKKGLTSISPGNRAALNLAGLERLGAQRGDAIVTPGAWHLTKRVHAEVRVLSPALAGESHDLKEKGAHLFYAGTAETPVRLRLIGSDRIEAGSRGFAELVLRDPLPLARGDRFVLRDAGRVLTIGGGQILDPWPQRGPRDPLIAEYLESIVTADPDIALQTLVNAEASVPVTQASLRTGYSEVPPGVVELGDTFVSDTKLAQLSDALRKEVADYHSREPLRQGIDREDLRGRLGIQERPMFDALLGIVDDIEQEGPLVRARTHQVDLDPEQRTQRDALIEALERDGLHPPLTKELTVAPSLLRALTDSGEIVSIGDFFLTARQIEDVRERVSAFISTNGSATVAQLRDVLQTSRKYAVPLCEWLDQQGITRRRGNDRVMGPGAAQ